MKRILIAALLVLGCATAAQAAWYEGGNLHGDNITSWLISTDANRLATAGDFVAGTTAPDQLRALSSSELKKAAQAVANCITSFGEQGVFDRNMSVEGAAMACLRDNKKKFPFFMTKEGVGTPPKKQEAAAEPQTQSLTWDITKAKPLPYAVVEAKKDHRATTGRTKLLIRIVPVVKGEDGKLQAMTGQDKVTKEQLAATVAAAAKHHAQTTGAHMVSVALHTQYFSNHGGARLAIVDYAPDGKGVSGKQNWTWDTFFAAEKGPSDAELKAEKPGALYIS